MVLPSDRPVTGDNPRIERRAATRAGTVAGVSTLAERLGHAADARLVIVNCDDLGSAHAANVGIYEALRDGVATSASLMVPCPWAGRPPRATSARTWACTSPSTPSGTSGAGGR